MQALLAQPAALVRATLFLQDAHNWRRGGNARALVTAGPPDARGWCHVVSVADPPQGGAQQARPYFLTFTQGCCRKATRTYAGPPDARGWCHVVSVADLPQGAAQQACPYFLTFTQGCCIKVTRTYAGPPDARGWCHVMSVADPPQGGAQHARPHFLTFTQDCCKGVQQLRQAAQHARLVSRRVRH